MPRRSKAVEDAQVMAAIEEFVSRAVVPAADLIAQAKADAARMLFEKQLPYGKKIGELTRSEAIAYSAELVALAHLLNRSASKLPEARS